MDFFDGKITLNPDFKYESDPSLNLAGLAYRDLKVNYPQVADRFENFNLSVMSVYTDDEAKINDLFMRLNQNRPLTGAEIRNAMRGPIPQLLRRLSEHRFFQETVKFPTRRSQDKNLAAKLLLIEFRGKLVDVKKTPLDRFVNDGLQADADMDEFERAANRVENILSRMTELFIPRDSLLSSQGSIPVYYWLIRGVDFDVQGRIREFLLDFEKKRRDNREIAKDSSKTHQVDPELVRYDNYDRSTNDQGSLEGRHEVLMKRLTRFAAQPPMPLASLAR